MDSVIRRCLALFLLVWWVGQSDAQLNFLTLREAEGLIELVPDVVASQQRGECPNINPGYTGGTELDLRVRTTCGPGSGMLIGAYTVNRRTGSVTTWGDNPESVADNQVTVLAARLVAEARNRILSPSEAQCLALAAANDLPGWSAGDATISVHPFSGLGTPSARAEMREGVMHLTATRVSSRPVVSDRMLTVYLSEARVRDEETGADLMSAAVGDLSAMLLELRAPVWLSDQEAASVALLVPRVAKNLREGCKLNGGGAFYSHDALMGVSCKEGSVRESNVLVNLETGTVTDPDTRKSLDTDMTQRSARALLANAQKRRTELNNKIEASCRAR